MCSFKSYWDTEGANTLSLLQSVFDGKTVRCLVITNCVLLVQTNTEIYANPAYNI